MVAARIIIIRHAEKTGLESDSGLSEQGILRATALSVALPRTFGRIDHVIAAQSTEHSVRPLRTVEPLAIALGTRVIQSWKTRDYEYLGESLRSNPEFEQRQVLVCWRHKSLQNLAFALGATGVEPWPETEYDRTWVLEYSTPVPTVQELRQKLNGKELEFHGQIAGPK